MYKYVYIPINIYIYIYAYIYIYIVFACCFSLSGGKTCSLNTKCAGRDVNCHAILSCNPRMSLFAIPPQGPRRTALGPTAAGGPRTLGGILVAYCSPVALRCAACSSFSSCPPQNRRRASRIFTCICIHMH